MTLFLLKKTYSKGCDFIQFIYTIIGTPLGYIMWALFFVLRNFAVSLILFTFLMKLAMLPFAIKQQKNMAKSSLFTPRIKEINKKYANNKQKQQEELMKLQQEGYNPMGGCGPMLINLLIIFGMIDVVYRPLTHILRIGSETINRIIEIAKTIDETITVNAFQAELRALNVFKSNPELFNEIETNVINKLSGIDLNFLGMNLGETPQLKLYPLIIIPILSLLFSFASSIISQKINERNNPDAANMGALKVMVYMGPLFSLYISFIVPAGVGFYWAVSYMFGIIQQLLLYKFYSTEKVLAKMKEEGTLSSGKINVKATVTDVNDNSNDDNSKNSNLSQKEINKRRLALARKLDAEKYGEEYIEDNED